MLPPWGFLASTLLLFAPSITSFIIRRNGNTLWKASRIGRSPQWVNSLSEDTGLDDQISQLSVEELLEVRAHHAQALNEIDDRIRRASSTTASRQPARINPKFPKLDYNYGYISKSRGLYLDTQNMDGQNGPPTSFLSLAAANFQREFREAFKQAQGNGLQVAQSSASSLDFSLLSSTAPSLKERSEGDPSRKGSDPVAAAVALVDPDEYLVGAFDGSPESEPIATKRGGGFDPSAAMRRGGLDKLVLSNRAVTEREEAREASGSGVSSPLMLKAPYLLLCGVIDLLFKDRPIQRFWFLETVARMPYFSYISMLHLYESLGWWRRSAEIKRVHFAEEWNEFHHLLIMESLGGDQLWSDRFFAQHSAVLYFWVLVGLWLVSPSYAYNFSQLIEAHAVDTYGEFLDANAELLATLPAPAIARQYYSGSDMYYFDEFQSCRARGSRRPVVETLHDVFFNICLDEGEHVATMEACQDPRVMVRSPNTEAVLVTVGMVAAVTAKLAERGAQVALELGEGDLTAAAAGAADAAAAVGVVDVLALQVASSFEAMQGLLASVTTSEELATLLATGPFKDFGALFFAAESGADSAAPEVVALLDSAAPEATLLLDSLASLLPDLFALWEVILQTIQSLL